MSKASDVAATVDAVAPPAESGQFEIAVPSTPGTDVSDFWRLVRESIRTVAQPARPVPDGADMEDGLSPVATLLEAPPRTIHSIAITRASPMSASMRAMLERREFGRCSEANQFDLASIEARLPGLECPAGPVEFLASDASNADLSLSVDCLLQHRKRLLAATVNPSRPRANVLVLGGGPGGLMAAIQLSLRGHRVILCEQREVYARNRFIGVYKPVVHLMASLGMPERMTYDFTHYRGKRGIMLADIQTFLHGVALKLGAIIYTGAVVRDLSTLGTGEVELQRSLGSGDGADSAAVGLTRWHHDLVTKVRSGVSICFDTIVEATGGRSGLRELLVGSENVVSLRTIGSDAALRDPSLGAYFDLPEDYSAQFVESNYGCPPPVRREFARMLLAGDEAIPDLQPSMVANVDASIIVKTVEAVPRKPGGGARIEEHVLDIPRDWVLVQCPLPDQRLTRYQIEGPLPRSFEFDGKQVPSGECLNALNPVTLLVRILYAMGVPFDAIDRRRLVEFYTQENSRGDASDIVAAWVGSFRGIRIGGDHPLWRGHVPGADSIQYGIIGEALQNAWYRFGVGVDDTFAGAALFAEGLELEPEARISEARRFERVMTARSVQILYHLYLVNQNTDQGVVGPVLTEAYMDRRHRIDVAEARLRDQKRQAMSMLATLADLRSDASSRLLEDAIEHRRNLCCRTVLGLFSSFDYSAHPLERALQAMRISQPNWRGRALAALESTLSASHLEILKLLAEPLADRSTPAGERTREERLVELGMGRYEWASPWVRACALLALDSSYPGAVEALKRASSDAIPLVAETAAAMLGRSGPTEGVAQTTADKVILLKAVSLFAEIPHEELVEVANLLTERLVAPRERIVTKGELGDCLYVIASGRVRVHDGERTLADLGSNQFFGELSLLDAETRSASVSAAEPSHLFRLEQADFYTLIAGRPQILQAINHRLCQMVRGMLTE